MDNIKYTLVFGYRRVLAFRKLGYTTINAINVNTKEFLTLKVDDINFLTNIRTDVKDDDLSQLMNNIKMNGLLHPVGVTTDADLNEADYLILNASENVYRKDIQPVEFGKVCSTLHDKHNLNLAEIAARFGCSPIKVKDAIRLYRQVPDQYRQHVGYVYKDKKTSKIGATVANAIVTNRLINKANKELLFKYTHLNMLTLRQIRLISVLLQFGYSLEQAINKIEEYDYLSPDLIVVKKVFVELKKKYKMSGSALLMSMLTNKIPLEPRLFKIE